MGLQRVGHDWATELNWTEALFQTFWFISYTMDLSIINLSKNHSIEVSINYFYFENDINKHFCFYEIGDFRFYFTVLFSLSKKSTTMSWENEFFISDSKYITKLFQFYRFGCSLWSSQAHIHHTHTHTHTQTHTTHIHKAKPFPWGLDIFTQKCLPGLWLCLHVVHSIMSMYALRRMPMLLLEYINKKWIIFRRPKTYL